MSTIMMHRRSAARIPSRVLVAVAALVLVIAASPTTRGSVETLSEPSSRLLDEEQWLKELATSVEAAGGLGLYREDDDTIVVTMPQGLAHSFDRRAARGLLEVRVEERPGDPATVEDLGAELDRLATKAAAAGDGGPYTFYYSPELGRIRVSSAADVRIFRDLVDRYPDLIEVHASTVSSARVTRHADSPPFWGGAEAALAGSLSDCTTGFAVKDSAEYLVVPRHCFVDNGISVVSPGNGKIIGATTRAQPFPLYDLQLIGGKDYGASIYTGDANSTAFRVVFNATDPAVGSRYCYSGAKTFEKCNQTVSSLDGKVCDSNGGCTSRMIVFAGGGQVKPGDSGAPFYLPLSSGGTLYAGVRGMVVARELDDAVTSYAHRYTTIANSFGVSILK